MKCFCGKEIQIGPKLAKHRLICAEFQKKHSHTKASVQSLKKFLKP